MPFGSARPHLGKWNNVHNAQARQKDRGMDMFGQDINQLELVRFYSLAALLATMAFVMKDNKQCIMTNNVGMLARHMKIDPMINPNRKDETKFGEDIDKVTGVKKWSDRQKMTNLKKGLAMNLNHFGVEIIAITDQNGVPKQTQGRVRHEETDIYYFYCTNKKARFIPNNLEAIRKVLKNPSKKRKKKG